MSNREKLIKLLQGLADEDVQAIYRHSNGDTGSVEINIEFNDPYRTSLYDEKSIEYRDSCAFWE